MNQQRDLSEVLRRLDKVGGRITHRLHKDTSVLERLQLPPAYRASETRSRGTVAVFNKTQIYSTVKEGARTGNSVQLVYRKKQGETVVRRTVSPYEYKNGFLFAKDAHTKSFIVDRILSAQLTTVPTTPDYPVKI